MKRASTTVNCAAAKIEPSSRRPVLLFAVLPFSLLLIGTGLAPFLTHNANAQASATPVTRTGTSAGASGIDSFELELKEVHRNVALDTVDRLEKKIRQSGGKVQISAVDLRRIRSALNKPQ